MNYILHRILDTQDLDTWSKLEKDYFQSPYDRIYDLVTKFYEKYTKLPTFHELELVTRSDKERDYIVALSKVEVPEDLDTEIIYQAVLNEYAQTTALSRLSSFVDDIQHKDVTDVVEELNSISIDIEDKTEMSGQIVMMNDYATFDEAEFLHRMPLGINNEFDAHSLGLAPTEFMMVGGFRGSGKSIVCNNVVCNQYLMDKPSLYFSIEMRGREVFQRNLSILSGVSLKNIKKGELNTQEKLAIAAVRAGMTEDGSTDLVKQLYESHDLVDFDRQVMQRPLKPAQLITVDNPSLTLESIDATIASYKTRLGENLQMVVVDYMNQITIKDGFDWKNQIFISRTLKELARKHEVTMIAPFQTDAEGGVRFAKGILDSPDWAYGLKSHKTGDEGQGTDAISFKCLKARNDAEMDFVSGMNWNNLTIHPDTVVLNTQSEKSSDESKETFQRGQDDIP